MSNLLNNNIFFRNTGGELEWLDTPLTQSIGAAYNILCQHENSVGQGVRLYNNAATNIYYVEYKTGIGMPWTAAAAPWAINGNYTDNYVAGNYKYIPRCKVDESGRAIIAYPYFNGRWTIAARWSDDLNNWSSQIAIYDGGGIVNAFVEGIDIRDDKAIITVSNDHANTGRIYYSTYSSGWNTWAYYGQTKVPNGTCPAWAFIQHYPGESGDLQYRFIALFRSQASTACWAEWCDAGGSNPGNEQIINVNAGAVAIDKIGNKNRITFGGLPSTASSNFSFKVSNDLATYAGFGFNNAVDANSGGSVSESYNGRAISADSSRHFHSLAIERRAVMIGEKAYAVMGTYSGASSTSQVNLYRTANASAATPTWAKEPVALGAAGSHDVEYCIHYISSKNSILVAWKSIGAALTSTLSYGQIFTRLGKINTDGSITWNDIVQVDGGELPLGFQGYLQSSESNKGVTLSWEEAGNDLWTNHLS